MFVLYEISYSLIESNSIGFAGSRLADGQKNAIVSLKCTGNQWFHKHIVYFDLRIFGAGAAVAVKNMIENVRLKLTSNANNLL